MKVIENKQKESAIFTCDTCGCRFSASIEDVTQFNIIYSADFVKCPNPTCMSSVWVKDEDFKDK